MQPKASLLSNVSIDSVYISNTSTETVDINVKLSNQGEALENITVSLFNNEALLAKSAVDLDGDTETTFTISNNLVLNGRLVVDDLGLQYDNAFYFNINAKPKIKVLAINENAESSFLNRIYTEDEFAFQSYKLDALNFNLIPDQNLIILNELDAISDALRTALKSFKDDGGNILIIPSGNISLNTYNQIFRELSISNYNAISTSENRITSINYNHPLLANAFYSKVTNFQYPKVNVAYRFATNANTVLAYDDGSSFLVGNAGAYAFSSAINEGNSNFKNSPLIVPVLYNIGKQSLKLPQLYYTIGQSNTIAINASLGQDDILTLNKADNSIIPLQKTYSKSVVLETDDYPNTAGILEVRNKAQVLQNLSFNYNRSESNLAYYDLGAVTDSSVSDSLAATINDIKSSSTINALWKWFVIFALVFLIVEVLLLKYLK